MPFLVVFNKEISVKDEQLLSKAIKNIDYGYKYALVKSLKDVNKIKKLLSNKYKITVEDYSKNSFTKQEESILKTNGFHQHVTTDEDRFIKKGFTGITGLCADICKIGENKYKVQIFIEDNKYNKGIINVLDIYEHSTNRYVDKNSLKDCIAFFNTYENKVKNVLKEIAEINELY